MTLKKRKAWCANQDRNLESATIHPMSICTSFALRGLCVSCIARPFFGLASILLFVSMKQRNLPPYTLKAHFSTLSLILYFLSCWKTSNRSKQWSHSTMVLATMLSVYTCRFFWFDPQRPCSWVTGRSPLRSSSWRALLCNKNWQAPWWRLSFLIVWVHPELYLKYASMKLRY